MKTDPLTKFREYYGPEGSPIAGSTLFRAYCRRCGEAIRTGKEALEHEKVCSDCFAAHPPGAHTGLTPRQRHKIGKTDGG